MTLKITSVLLAQIGAGLMFYTGFLPLKEIPVRVFSWLSMIAGFSWFVATFGAETSGYYTGGLALVALAAQRQFGRNQALAAKLMLSLGSSLGITLGFLMVLQAAPLSLPTGCPGSMYSWFVAWHYLGGAVVATTLMAALLAAFATSFSEIGAARLRKATGLVLGALGLRFLLAIALLLILPRVAPDWGIGFWKGVTAQTQLLMVRLILGLAVPAGLAFAARRALGREDRSFALWLLSSAAISALVGEGIAQLLYF